MSFVCLVLFELFKMPLMQSIEFIILPVLEARQVIVLTLDQLIIQGLDLEF